MRTRSITIRVLTLAVLFFSSASAFSPGQSQERQPLGRERIITVAREIMAAARYCALITRDASGRAHARTLDPFPPDEQMIVWLGTNPRSRKVAEIRRDHRVTLYYFDRDGQSYVTIYGTARLVNNPAEKAKRWKDEWQAFYSDRAKDYLLIEVTPEQLEVVSVSKGIVGDARNWRPPSISFPGTKRRFRKPR